MLSNLLALTGNFALAKHDVRNAYGAFTLKREIKVAVSGRGQTNSRKMFVSEGYTALGQTTVRMIPVVNDTRGLDRTMVDDAGEVTGEMLAAKVRLNGGVSNAARVNIASLAYTFIRPDSQISLLVGLLSTYYVLKGKELGMKQDLRDYDDGHIKIAMIDDIADPPAGANWWTSNQVMSQTFNPVSVEGEAIFPVLSMYGMHQKDGDIILAHLGGRHRTTRFAFDLEIPALAHHVAIAGLRHDGSTTPNYAAFTAADVLATLNRYVEHNRLYGAMEAAIAYYHQIALTPLPDTAEGHAWLTRRKVAYLPRFDSFRGIYAFSLSGVPYAIDTAVTETWKWWTEVGLATAIPAAAMNAFSLWGRYLAEGGFYSDDAEIDRLGDLQFAENPAAAYYAYAALVTGENVYCPLPHSLGVSYEAWRISSGINIDATVIDAEATGYDLEYTDDRARLVIKRIPPPCSAVHVLGRMPKDSAFSALSERFRVNLRRIKDGWVLPTVNEAWGFGLASRWAGYDAEMEYRGEVRRANWAPNQSSIAARPFNVDGPDIIQVVLRKVTPREKMFFFLPGMDGDHVEIDVEVAVSQTVVLMAKHRDWSYSAGNFYPPRRREADVRMPPRVEVAFLPTIITASRRADVSMSGFRVVRDTIPHEPADPVSLTIPAEPPDDTATSGATAAGTA
jgi:hypothetical protein